MFSYKYLNKHHLKGFDKYKYSAIDTSPLSQYVMHPTWNYIVKFIPKWIAPNLLTFSGFVCMALCVIILLIYDYDCTAASLEVNEENAILSTVFTICGVLVFLAYNLDGIDGKQARRIGVSGPVGEMFDHGLDSYIVFLIPYSLLSVFGRDEFSVPIFRGYLIILSIVLNFYASHWEKYNTGTLYLPWGYDLSMWISTLLFLYAGVQGPAVYKTYVFGNITFVQALEAAIHATGLFTTLPVAIYNVLLSYKNKTGKLYSLQEALRPIYPMFIMTLAFTTWALKSPNNVMERDPRAFLLAFGTIFSNIASRLIVSEMSGQRCDVICWINIPLIATVLITIYQPHLELLMLYGFLVFVIAAHLHYGICVISTLLFLYAGVQGPAVYKTYVFGNITFVQALEAAIHATGLFTTLPVAIYNVLLSYKNKTGKLYSLQEALRPIYPMFIMTLAFTTWALKSPNNVMERDPRAFLLAFGTIFSNIASRLIVSEMSGQRCDVICWINIPLIATVLITIYQPHLELLMLYGFLVFVIAAHLHYGICVVRQMCDHFKIKCFTVPREKIK